MNLIPETSLFGIIISWQQEIYTGEALQQVMSFLPEREIKGAPSSEFGTYRLCEQRRFRRACASAQSRQNLRCSLIQAVNQQEPSDRKPNPWPLWMAGQAQLKFVMTECSKTQIRLTGLKEGVMWLQYVPLVPGSALKQGIGLIHTSDNPKAIYNVMTIDANHTRDRL